MKTNHNLYVSTPNWFSSIKEEVKQTKPVIQLTVYYGSGSNSNNNGISSLSIYNKAVYKEDTLQLSDLSITGYAIIAILKEGEENNAGELTVNDVWSSSLFIPVVGGSEITINTSYDSTFTYGIAFYDILKKYISGNHTVQELIQTVTVPANAVYFRICSLSVYEEFNVKYQGLSNYSYKQLTDIYDKGLDPFTNIDNSFEYLYSSTFASDKISFVADYPLKLEIDSDNNIHFNINDLLLSGVFVTTSEEEQDIAGIKIFKNGLGIGDFLLVPDKTNNSIKLIHKNELIEKESNTYFGNMYVTGWFSALGMSPDGIGPSFGGSNNLFELNDVSAVYNELGIPYAVLGTTGENTVGKVLTWDGSKWYADESLNSIKGDERYLLKKIFSKIFTAYDEKGEIIDITDYNSIIDNISINYSLWSTGFISAYGMSKGDSNPTALYQLTDVLSDNNEVQGAVIGSVLTYNGTHWYASKLNIDSSIDTNDVLNILKQYNYLTKGDAEELFLTKNQADDKYLLKQVFKNIFTAYDANNNEVDICDIFANINNIKINYGFWSDGFISALGKQLTEPSSTTALYQLVDVLANETNTGVKYAKKGSVLTFDGVHWVAGVVNTNGGIIDEAAIMEIIERYNYIDSKYLSDNGYLTIGSANELFLDQTEGDKRYLLNDLFLKIFTAYDEQGNQVNLSSNKIDNIKVNYNFWSDGYLSSRGISDDIIDAIDFIEVDEKTISKRNGYLEVIGGVGNNGIESLTVYIGNKAYYGSGTSNITIRLPQYPSFDGITSELSKYALLSGKNTFTGENNFTGSLKINGSPIVYNATGKYWKLEGDLIVTGGVSMFSNDSSFTPSTITQAVNIDGSTLVRKNGVIMLNPDIQIGGGSDIDLSEYAKKATTLAGYDIADAYTKTEVDNNFVAKTTKDFMKVNGSLTSNVDFNDYYTSGSYNNTTGNGSGNSNAPGTYGLMLVFGDKSGYAAQLHVGASADSVKIRTRYSHGDSMVWKGWNELVVSNYAHTITPSETDKYNLGASSYQWSNLYTKKTTIDGIEIKKSASGVLYIGGNLVVSGGITMYGTDGTTANTIWDDAPIANTNGKKGVASYDPNFFAVNNGVVTFVGQTGGGVADSVAWKNIDGVPSWITDTKPEYKYSEIKETPNLDEYAKKGTTLSAYGITDANINNGVITLGNNTIAPLTQSLGDARYVTALGTSGNDLTWTKNGTTNKITVPFATNSLTADKLSKTWSIWGKSFNGSNDVYGDVTEVGDIYMDGYLRMYSSDYDYMRVVGVNSYNHLVIGYDVWNNERNTYLYGDTIYLYTGSSVSILDTNGYLYAGTGIGVRSNGSYVRTMLYCDDEEDAVYLQAGNYSGSSRNGTLVFSGISGRDLTLCEVRGDFLATGGITMYSDERKKTILNHVELSLKEVAEAPLIEHYYNSDEKKTTHVGSIAQYWAGLNDWFCKEDEEGFLTMEIQNAALASAISVARELTRYESKTDKQIKKLKKRIGELEKEIENLKKV